MPLIPNPVGPLLRRVDDQLEAVDSLLGRVEGTLGDTHETLEEVAALLTELKEELQLLHRVPEMAAQLDEIHRIVSAQGSKTGA
jgi:ABC-type transporter Mla subunit MlaD